MRDGWCPGRMSHPGSSSGAHGAGLLHAWAGTAAALLRVGSASGTEKLFSAPESSGLANPSLPRYRFGYMEPLSPAVAHRQDRAARRLRHREGSTEPLPHSNAPFEAVSPSATSFSSPTHIFTVLLYKGLVSSPHGR